MAFRDLAGVFFPGSRFEWPPFPDLLKPERPYKAIEPGKTCYLQETRQAHAKPSRMRTKNAGGNCLPPAKDFSRQEYQLSSIKPVPPKIVEYRSASPAGLTLASSMLPSRTVHSPFFS